MTLTVIYTVVLLAIAGGTVLFGLFRWVAKLNENTKATERLTDAFAAFADKIELRLDNHETRISRLEGKSNVQ